MHGTALFIAIFNNSCMKNFTDPKTMPNPGMQDID